MAAILSAEVDMFCVPQPLYYSWGGKANTGGLVSELHLAVGAKVMLT